MMEATVVSYRIDRTDRLLEVNDEWKRFAVANDAPELVDGVLNRSLWAFIADATTANVYHQLLSRVRAGHVVTFPFRCDAPALRRWMQMRMSSLANGEILFESAIVETQPTSAGTVWDRRAARGADFLTTCSWCKRMKVEDRWEEVEDAVALLALFLQDRLPMITHGMCPRCYASIMESLDPSTPPGV
jgi:hypothetical protein